jgi:hypothetical protein
MIKDIINREYRTTEDVCSILDMSRMTLYRKEKLGYIKGYRVGKRKYYNINDIESFLLDLFSKSVSSNGIKECITTK